MGFQTSSTWNSLAKKKQINKKGNSLLSELFRVPEVGETEELSGCQMAILGKKVLFLGSLEVYLF